MKFLGMHMLEKYIKHFVNAYIDAWKSMF